jgi:hypothetical protein
MGRAIIVANIVLAFAFCNWNDTSTGIDLNKLPQFPLSLIAKRILTKFGRTNFSGITVADTPEEVRVSGRAKSGKAWEAHLCSTCDEEVWRGDLDGNGTQDYIFFGVGPFSNGRTAPLYSLNILLMDEQGLPVPFFTVVYHGENGDGVKHLVDLDHDGRAELLISTYDEIGSDPRVEPMCSGHWTTQVYQFRNLSAEEFTGTMGGFRFPFIHNWTYRGTVCSDLEKLWSERPPIIYDYGTGANGELTTRILRPVANWVATITPVDGCKEISPTVILYDRPRIRQVAFPNPRTNFDNELTGAIRAAGVPVTLRGTHRRGGDCIVNLASAGQ